MRQRWWIAVAVGVILSLGAAVPVLPQEAAGASAAVRVFQFQPGALQVRAGTRVTWTNQDEITHTVTSGVPGSPDGRFDVSLAGKGASGGATFAVAGTYPYFCARHPSMRGEVVVQ